MKTSDKITLKEKISYGSGDIASCVTFNVTSSYLSYYYTDIAGISVIVVGIIMGISRVVEALVNFATGIAIDRINTKKGKTRPILLATNLPLVLLFVLLFSIPDISMNAKIIFAFFSCLGFCIMYAVNNTAYCTMISLLTNDISDRKELGNYKSLGGGIGSLIASFCTLPLIAFFGLKGKYQFLPPALIYAVIAFIILMNCAIVCKERVGADQEKIGFLESIRCAAKSKSWIILCIISFLSFMANTLRGQSCIYYAKYCLGLESWATVLLTVMTIAQIVTSPFVAKLLIKLGNQKSLMCGFTIYIIASIGMSICGSNLFLLIILTFISGVGSTLTAATAFTICSDTMDEVEELTGKRPQGIMTSIMMCAMKLGIAGAGIISSIVLNKGGYIADQIQSVQALKAISWNMFWIPVIIYIIGLIMTRFFKCK